MKKIIGIIAAVAMAASVFALDFSGAVKVSGSLFNMDFANGAMPTALSVGLANGGKGNNSRFQTSISVDKAGAEFAIGSAGVAWVGATLWVQPIDMLKITFLNTDSKLNQVFDYSGDEATFKAAGSWNFEIKPADPVTINLVLGSPWLNAGVIGDTGLVFKFGADFGTIGAIVKYSQSGIAGAVTNNVGFGLGYSGTFDPISMFVDVGAATTNDFKAMTLAAEAQVVANLDALNISFYALYKNAIIGGTNDFLTDNSLKARLKIAYAMDAATIYFKFNSADLLATALDLEFQPGVEFKIGAAGCDVGVNVHVVGSKVTLDVPFTVEVGF